MGILCCSYYSQLCGRNGPRRFLHHAYVGKLQRLSEGLEREHLGKIPVRGAGKYPCEIIALPLNLTVWGGNTVSRVFFYLQSTSSSWSKKIIQYMQRNSDIILDEQQITQKHHKNWVLYSPFIQWEFCEKRPNLENLIFIYKTLEFMCLWNKRTGCSNRREMTFYFTCSRN